MHENVCQMLPLPGFILEVIYCLPLKWQAFLVFLLFFLCNILYTIPSFYLNWVSDFQTIHFTWVSRLLDPWCWQTCHSGMSENTATRSWKHELCIITQWTSLSETLIKTRAPIHSNLTRCTSHRTGTRRMLLAIIAPTTVAIMKARPGTRRRPSSGSTSPRATRRRRSRSAMTRSCRTKDMTYWRCKERG